MCRKRRSRMSAHSICKDQSSQRQKASGVANAVLLVFQKDRAGPFALTMAVRFLRLIIGLYKRTGQRTAIVAFLSTAGC